MMPHYAGRVVFVCIYDVEPMANRKLESTEGLSQDYECSSIQFAIFFSGFCFVHWQQTNRLTTYL